jgi:hypothetical protein
VYTALSTLPIWSREITRNIKGYGYKWCPEPVSNLDVKLLFFIDIKFIAFELYQQIYQQIFSVGIGLKVSLKAKTLHCGDIKMWLPGRSLEAKTVEI